MTQVERTEDANNLDRVEATMEEVRRLGAGYVDSGQTRIAIRIAELELETARLRQHELTNMIAMLSNPSACPYPGNVVRDRIKELTQLTP